MITCGKAGTSLYIPPNTITRPSEAKKKRSLIIHQIAKVFLLKFAKCLLETAVCLKRTPGISPVVF